MCYVVQYTIDIELQGFNMDILFLFILICFCKILLRNAQVSAVWMTFALLACPCDAHDEQSTSSQRLSQVNGHYDITKLAVSPLPFWMHSVYGVLAMYINVSVCTSVVFDLVISVSVGGVMCVAVDTCAAGSPHGDQGSTAQKTGCKRNLAYLYNNASKNRKRKNEDDDQ